MKECYYSVLGVDKSADDDAIKKAYRQMALRHHPDKHTEENREVSTARFQLISEAYEVLSNKQERSWYDTHRDQILRGSARSGTDGEVHSTKEDIWRYFSTSCFGGRVDDSEGGFYRTYRRLFDELARLESEECDSDEEGFSNLPSFGDSKSEWEDVQSFYSSWDNFHSSRRFWDFDKWDLREGENRQVRRAMEVENKKARGAARKEFSSAVRSLVAFVKRRDSRVIDFHAKKAERDRISKEDKERESKERDERRKIAREVAREEEMLRWAEVDRIRTENGVVESSSSDESDKVLECVACKKVFKSENAFANHEASKKHKQQIAKLRAELMLSCDEDDAVPEQVVQKIKKPNKKKTMAAPFLATDPLSEDEMEKDLEIIVPQNVKEKKPRRRASDKKKSIIFACKTCSESFPSKSALFKHLDEFGHHAPLR